MDKYRKLEKVGEGKLPWLLLSRSPPARQQDARELLSTPTNPLVLLHLV